MSGRNDGGMDETEEASASPQFAPPTPGPQQTPSRSRNNSSLPPPTQSPYVSSSQQSDYYNIQSTPIQIRDREFVPSSTIRPRGDLGHTATTNAAYSSLRATEYISAGRNGNRMIVVSTPMDERATPQHSHTQVTQRIQGLRAPLNFAGLLDEADYAQTRNGNNKSLDAMIEEEPVDSQEEQQAETRIWGTDINVKTCAEVFRSFLHFFTLNNPNNHNNSTRNNHSMNNGESLSYYRQCLFDLVTHASSASNSISPIHNNSNNVLSLDMRHLLSFPATRQLHQQLLHFPQDIIPILDHVAHDETCHLFAMQGGADYVNEQLSQRRIQVRPCHLPDKSRIRSLDPQDIETLVSIQGLVIRVSGIVPDLKQAFFRCSMCHHCVTVVIDRGKINEPVSCVSCNAVGSVSLVHNRCVFSDKQLIRVQERPDEVPEGETPTTVSVFAYDDLVDVLRPGDRVILTGILRAVPRRQSNKQRAVLSVFRTFLDAIHFERKGIDLSLDMAQLQLHTSPSQPDVELQNAQLHEENMQRQGLLDEEDVAFFNAHTSQGMDIGHPEDMDMDDREKHWWQMAEAQVKTVFSKEKLRAFRRFARREDVYEVLLKSFAPSVYAMEDVKQGLLCLLFGGTYKHPMMSTVSPIAPDTDTNNTLNNTNSHNMNNHNNSNHYMHQRGDINILLCGDPGTSKSQLLSYVHQLSPRGIYTSGRGSSAVGLTASVVRDPETRDTVLESGALVLSDRGVCCIDEFDKMSVGARAVLHEALEQQSVSVTKAGIVATLHARAAVLASANPAQSRYNPRLSVTDNLQLPPTLLSRFDLIFLILDRADAEHDRRLAKHLVSLYYDLSEGDTAEEENKDTTMDEEGPRQKQTGNDKDVDEDVGVCRSVSQQFLREFIQFARVCCAPQLSLEAQEALVTHYLELRHHHYGGATANNATTTATTLLAPGGGLKVVSATPRQLESLIRLSQARAKMRLSVTVTQEDVTQSVRLMRVATQSAATDPRTGLIDMDLLTTGHSLSTKRLSEEMQHALLCVLASLYINNSSSSSNSNSNAVKRINLPQLRQELQRFLHNTNRNDKHNNNLMNSVSGSDVETAVRALEAEGILQYVARTHTVMVRPQALHQYLQQHQISIDGQQGPGHRDVEAFVYDPSNTGLGDAMDD